MQECGSFLTETMLAKLKDELTRNKIRGLHKIFPKDNKNGKAKNKNIFKLNPPKKSKSASLE